MLGGRDTATERDLDDLDIEEPRKCPICMSARLSPQAQYTGQEHQLVFSRLGGKGLLGGKKDLMLQPRRARVCLECGFVLLFLDSTQLKELAAARK